MFHKSPTHLDAQPHSQGYRLLWCFNRGPLVSQFQLRQAGVEASAEERERLLGPWKLILCLTESKFSVKARFPQNIPPDEQNPPSKQD